jgi:hypothetical protein
VALCFWRVILPQRIVDSKKVNRNLGLGRGFLASFIVGVVVQQIAAGGEGIEYDKQGLKVIWNCVFMPFSGSRRGLRPSAVLTHWTQHLHRY